MKLCSVCGSPEHPEWKAHVFVSQTKKKEVANEIKSVVANKVKRGTYEYRDVDRRRAYQRVLMALKRTVKAVERGRADWWPRRVA